MKITCPNCSQNLDIPEELAGQSIDCPVCSKSLIAPVAASSTQTKLKIAQTPNTGIISKRQISKQQSSEGMPPEDIIRNLSDDITQGSPTAMHVASHLTGSRTPLRETSASKISGSMTSMIVGIFVVGIVLLRLGFGEDLFKGGVVKTHERIVSIEQKMIDAYNLSNTPQDAAKAITAAVAKLKKIKTENLDEEYKGALQDYIKALQKWSLALKRGDPIKADEFDDLRIDETRRLNEIYEKQPEVVTPLRF